MTTTRIYTAPRKKTKYCALIASALLASAAHSSEPGPLAERPTETDRAMLREIESPLNEGDITFGNRTKISASIPLKYHMTLRGSFSICEDLSKMNAGMDIRVLSWLNRSTFDFYSIFGEGAKTASSETGSVEAGLGVKVQDNKGSPAIRLAGKWNLGDLKSVIELQQPLDGGDLGLSVLLKYPLWWKDHYLAGRVESDDGGRFGLGYGIEF